MTYKPDLTDEYLKKYFRTFRIGRLFFKYVKGTPLEAEGWTSDGIAEVLAECGCIRIVDFETKNGSVKVYHPGVVHYVELPGKMPRQQELVALLKGRKAA